MADPQHGRTDSRRSTLKLAVLAFAILLLVTGVAAQTPSPVIFFTDLTSGPNSGGESVSGYAGAYVTIYGNNFGTSQGSSTVTLNGASCLRVVSWGTTWLWYQKIVVQLGSACPTATGNFVITVAATASNSAPFTVRSGNIYCVSTSGSNSNSGHFPNCWGDMGYATQNSPANVAAGDIIYVLNGVSQAPGVAPGYSSTLTLGVPGTAASPIALVAYPGATVTVGTATGDERGIYACGGLSLCTNGAYWTVAGLTVRSVCEVFQINTTGLRLVANDISDPNCVSGESGSITEGGSNVQIYGNSIHDTAANTVSSVTKLHHATYIGDGDNAVYVAWNSYSNNHGNRSIQVYTSTPGGSGDIYDVHVHDNQISNSRGVGILFNQVNTSKGTLEAYNNLIYNAGLGPDFADGNSQWDCTLTSSTASAPIQIYNNTIYNCGYNGGGGPGGGCYSTFSATNLENNICYEISPFSYFDGSIASGVTCSNNLFYGAGSTPSGCSAAAVNANPQFAGLANFDFHLVSSSPAIDKGMSIANLTWDLDGTTRPQGAAFDIGAYEFFSGTAPPSPPTNLTVTVQ